MKNFVRNLSIVAAALVLVILVIFATSVRSFNDDGTSKQTVEQTGVEQATDVEPVDDHDYTKDPYEHKIINGLKSNAAEDCYLVSFTDETFVYVDSSEYIKCSLGDEIAVNLYVQGVNNKTYLDAGYVGIEKK
jgi:hypothetical protein